jgi:DegV family protein with EDD domain
MKGVRLITDSACDLPPGMTAEAGIDVLPFPYTLDGVERLDDFGRSITFEEFYAALDAGAVAHTAQVPLMEYADAFGRAHADGCAVVLVSLSSALSGSHESSLLARQAFLDEHPDAEIHCVDSLCASAGQGLLVLGAARRLQAGASAVELASWIEAERGRLNHVFTVSSFDHLVRGGRVSPVVAMAGAMLDIKPVMRMDAGGHLVPVKKPRGRRRAIETMADIVAERIDNPSSERVIVSHGDCAADAELLCDLLRERAGVVDIVTTRIGVIIGTHTGGGVLSAYFWGQTRE